MQIISNISGNPPISTPIYECLFCFIENYLPDFKPFRRKEDGNLVNSEDDITEELVDYLDDKQELLLIDNPQKDANNAFKFTNQSKQGNKKTDIGVKLGRRYSAENRPLICWIEAKRLPTPNSNKDRDEREYVIVDKKKSGGGGIQRFKEGEHASKLNYSIMFGYIQENDTSYWLDKINTWIKDLANEESKFWSIEDCLSKLVSDKCDRFLSAHKRKDKSKITLHHFWIKL